MSGRFQILEAGQLMLPAKCISCGSSQTDRKYVDLEITAEFYGSIYFCGFCFSSTAEDLNFVPAETHNFIQIKCLRMEQRICELEAQNEAIKRAMATVLAPSFSFDGSVDDFVRRAVSDVQGALQPVESTAEPAKPSKGPDTSECL